VEGPFFIVKSHSDDWRHLDVVVIKCSRARKVHGEASAAQSGQRRKRPAFGNTADISKIAVIDVVMQL
jgi:hypothetical protein